jgi:hypothetical protein
MDFRPTAENPGARQCFRSRGRDRVPMAAGRHTADERAGPGLRHGFGADAISVIEDGA